MSITLQAVLAVITAVFSSGVTWGVMSSRQKTTEEKNQANENRIDVVVKNLQEAVRKLDGMATEFQVWKAASTRYERDIEDHDKRIKDLEIAFAKRSTRKR